MCGRAQNAPEFPYRHRVAGRNNLCRAEKKDSFPLNVLIIFDRPFSRIAGCYYTVETL